jgi:hypothetical protein
MISSTYDTAQGVHTSSEPKRHKLWQLIITTISPLNNYGLNLIHTGKRP